MEKSGKFFEDYIRDTFNLKQTKFSSLQPDILDFDENIIGEIKTAKKFSPDQRILLYEHQIKKYIHLKENLLSQSFFNGSKNFEFLLFINFYEKKGLDELLLDTFILDEKQTNEILNSFGPKNTKWNTKGKTARRLALIEDENQITFGDRNGVRKELVYGNVKGTYVRPKISDLKKICPQRSGFENSFRAYDIKSNIYFNSGFSRKVFSL